MKKCVFEDENVYVKGLASGEPLHAFIVAAAKRELDTFSKFGALTVADFAEDMGVSIEELSGFESFNADMGALYAERTAEIHKHGYGIFSAHGMFRLSDEKEIEPIVSADKIGMDSFIGYEAERGKVEKNTRAFIECRPAANTLLCGDAGTGKSSTVKAVANSFFKDGVRLIELRKDQLRFLPQVMGKISGNPLKFIIFIDDLSFNQNDDNFSMLKAALEGSASAKADNAVIYATSNRRHIIKESFGDREGDDLHRNDTLQET
jgi:predicted AAA+ superfamily ATPase